MKRSIWIFLAFSVLFVVSPCFAVPGPGGPGMGRSGGIGRPPMGAANRPPLMRGGVSTVRNFNRPPMVRPNHMARPPIRHMAGIRPLPPPPPPVYRPYRPLPIFYRPYYSTYPIYYSSYTYLPVSSYYYEGLTPVASSVNAVVVRDNYAGINTAANVINAAANAATAIKFLSW